MQHAIVLPFSGDFGLEQCVMHVSRLSFGCGIGWVSSYKIVLLGCVSRFCIQTPHVVISMVAFVDNLRIDFDNIAS